MRLTPHPLDSVITYGPHPHPVITYILQDDDDDDDVDDDDDGDDDDDDDDGDDDDTSYIKATQPPGTVPSDIHDTHLKTNIKF